MPEFGNVELPEDFDASLLEKQHIQGMGGDVGKLIREYDAVKRYNDNLKTTSIRPPAADSDDYGKPETWESLHAKVNALAPEEYRNLNSVPESAEAYNLVIPEEMSEHREAIDAKLKEYHEAGLTRGQAQKRINALLEQTVEAQKAAESAITDRREYMVKELGLPWESIEAKGHAAIRNLTTNEADIEAIGRVLANAAPEDAVALQRALNGFADRLTPEQIAHVDIQKASVMSRDQILSRINEMMENPTYQKYMRGETMDTDTRAAMEAKHREVVELRGKLREVA